RKTVREKQRRLALNYVEYFAEVARVRRSLERVRRRVEVVENIATRRSGYPGRFGSLGLPVLVETPHQVRQPENAAFVKNYLERRKFLEYSLGHQARDVRHVALRQRTVP